MSMAAIAMTTIMAKQRSKILPGKAGEDSLADAAALYRLMAWLSPAYPVGAFSYSGGIEWAVEAGDIKDAETLRLWLAVMLGEGSGFCDAVFFVHAHRAIAAADDAALRAVAELAAAFVPSKERFLETTAQGRAFLEATGAAWPCPALTRFAAVWTGPVALPVAVGVACAGHGIACETAFCVFQLPNILNPSADEIIFSRRCRDSGFEVMRW